VLENIHELQSASEIILK